MRDALNILAPHLPKDFEPEVFVSCDISSAQNTVRADEAARINQT